MSARPPVEATMLAWLCGVDVADVHRAAAVLGLRFSDRYLMPLRDITRIAYHLGTHLEQRRAIGAAPVGRFLAKVHFRDAEERWVDLWGIEGGELMVQWFNDTLGCDAWATGWCDLGSYLGSFEVDDSRVRVTSWLVLAGRVHT